MANLPANPRVLLASIKYSGLIAFPKLMTDKFRCTDSRYERGTGKESFIILSTSDGRNCIANVPIWHALLTQASNARSWPVVFLRVAMDLASLPPMVRVRSLKNPLLSNHQRWE